MGCAGGGIRLQRALHTAEPPGGLANVLYCPGIQLFQKRHHLKPQEIPAGGLRVGIGFVLNMGDVPLSGILLQLRPGHAQQRAADSVLLPAHSRQTCKSGSPGQIQEDGLRIVIGVVGSVNPFTILLRRRPAQKSVAQVPGGLLNGKRFLPGIFPHVPPAHSQGDPPRSAGLSDKYLVPVRRFISELVIEMGGQHRTALLPAPHVQQEQQAHGVQSPGDGAQHPLSRPGQNRPGEAF